ncbi:hypothetical protein [Siminovitchia fortis]|uniref:hypothetical protein n=1 Tax=Siminovitchia fortis TaxID=254758 RepID=UPI0011A4A1AE|nr:hypothetical protein [Siminovitchia fortis]
MDIRKIKELKGKPAVLDNNVICDFIELGCIELLNEVFSTVLIPQSIYEHEIREADAEHLEYLSFELANFSTETAYGLFLEISTSKRKLSDYDVEVIVIAFEQAVLCTSNERRIKETCDEYNIEHTGTIGILSSCFEHGILSDKEFRELIIKLFNECTCRISEKLKQQVFKQYPFL